MERNIINHGPEKSNQNPNANKSSSGENVKANWKKARRKILADPRLHARNVLGIKSF